MDSNSVQSVFLSLGSNLGDRAANLRAAIRALQGCGEVAKVSPFFETEPVEYSAQPWFLNCAVELRTELAPKLLLEKLLAIERGMGRDRAKETQAKGPRMIDLDILLYGDLVLRAPGLTLPHPAMHLRRFVLAPLAAIAPKTVHPVLRQSVEIMLETLSGSGGEVREYDEIMPSEK